MTKRLLGLSLGLVLVATVTACPKQAPSPASKAPDTTTSTAPADHKEPAPVTASTGGTTYGAPVEGTVLPITELFTNAAAHEGETVVVEGTLGEVCQSMGCWFYLKDAADTSPNAPTLYIDLQMGAVFVIPENSAGKHGKILGRVEKEGAGWKLIGKGVELS